MDWGKNSKGGGVNTITIAEIAQLQDLSADWVIKLRKTFWAGKFPAPLVSKGNKLVFERKEVLEMLEKYPYIKSEKSARSRKITKDMRCAEFAPRAYVLDLDYLNWLSGGVNESIRLAYND